MINPFGNITFNNQLRNLVMKVGANLMSVNWNIGGRVRYAVSDNQGQVSLATRGEIVSGPWTIAGYKSVNLNNLVLLNNALKIRYLSGDNELVLTAEQNDHREISNFRFANL